MPYYIVKFRYVDKTNKIRRDSVRLDALNQVDAKRRAIRGERPKIIAVDSVKRL